MIEKKPLGPCHPFRLNDARPTSIPYQWKKLKTSSSTPLIAVVISPGVNFLRSKTYPLFFGAAPDLGT